MIDNRNAYHVFLTPEGDSNGLYVTQKSTAGFVVRKAHGGRSTMAFEYRILAKPIDGNGVRLAVAPPLPNGDPLARYARVRRRSAPVAKPLDAFARLKMNLRPRVTLLLRVWSPRRVPTSARSAPAVRRGSRIPRARPHP